MPKLTMFAEKPSESELVIGTDSAVAIFRENIRETASLDENETIQFVADVYEMPISLTKNISERFAEQKESWKQIAIQMDYDKSAAEIRAERNKLLDETDNEMSIDRIITNLPGSVTTLKDVIQVLGCIVSTLTGGMAKYRQALRDVPQQDGFPYHVEWPTKPGK